MRKCLERYSWVTIILCLGITACSMIYRIHLHSDILFFEFFLEEIFEDPSAWQYWKSAPAPGYFPDMLIYALSFLLGGSAPLSIFMVTFFQVVLISCFGEYVIREVGEPRRLFASVIFQFLLFLTVISALHATNAFGELPSQKIFGMNRLFVEIGTFFNANNIQVPSVISSLLLLGMYVSFLRKPTWLIVPFLVFIGAFAYASSMVFFVNFVAPFILTLLCALGLAVYKQDTVLLKSCVSALIILCVSQVGGYLLSDQLAYPELLNGRLVFSLSRTLHSMHVFLLATRYMFDTSNILSWAATVFFTCVCLFSFFRSLLFLWNLVRSKEQGERSVPPGMTIACFFLLATAATSFAGSMISGGFTDVHGYRYFMTAVGVSSILTALFIDQQCTAKTAKKMSAMLAVACIFITLYSTWSIHNEKNKRTMPQILASGAILTQAEKISVCLDKLSEQGVTLHSGLGDFWNAKSVMYYLHHRYYIQQTFNDLMPFFWISTTRSLIDPERYRIKQYNFIILDRINDKQFRYSMAMMKDVLPKGGRLYSCDDAGADILVYDGNQLDVVVREKFQQFLVAHPHH